MTQDRLIRGIRLGLLPVVDVLLFNLAFVAAYGILLLAGQPAVFDTYTEMLLTTILVPPLVFYLVGLYRPWDEYAFNRSADAIFTGVAASLAVILFCIWLNRENLQALRTVEALTLPAIEHEVLRHLVWGFPIRVLLIALALAPFFIWLWRLVANVGERVFIGWSARPRNVLIVGRMAAEDIRRIETGTRPVYRILGFLGEGGEAPREGLERLGTPAELPLVLAAREVDEVFLVAPGLTRETLFAAVEACFAHGARPRLVMGVYEALISASQTELRAQVPFYRFRSAGIVGWTYVIKRLLDVAVAAVVLIVTTPVLLLACIAIVIDSKGWPIFSQERVGLHGRRFRLYKLRTMVVDADWRGGPLTEDNDPRVTRVGRWLRRTSIDELPQLWSVLRGDMSLVGPRAVVPYVAERFEEWEYLSLTVRPGITGLAQVSGRDEMGFREKSLLNLYYVRNHSIWMDLRILLDTIGVVLSMEGTGGTRTA